MPPSLTFGKFQFDLSPAATARPRDPEEPFRLVVLADLSGRASRGVVAPVAGRKPVLLDTDTLEAELARLQAVVRISGAAFPGGQIELAVPALEAFHPDALVRHPFLSEWLEFRRQLAQPATASAAAAEVQRRLAESAPTAAVGAPAAGSSTAPPPSAPPPAPASGAGESSEDTLARLLGKPASGASSTAAPSAAPAKSVASAVDALIRGVIASAVVPERSTEQAVGQQTVEGELSRRLRLVLHHPAWQAVEAAWLGVDLLVREFGGEENLRILLLDVSREELEADLTAHDDLAASGVFRVLRDVAPGAVVAAFTVTAERAGDFEWISRLARVGQAVRAPVFAGIHERLIGCGSIAATPDPDDWTAAVPADVTAAWQTLRKRTEARSLGLALPRIVMRLPYGRGLEAVEAFAFEEMGAGRRHEAYLWGNPAFACAHAVLDGFRGEGWDHVLSGAADLGERPVHRFTEDGSTQVQPCGEAWLSDRASERLQDAGLIPVQSIKGRDVIRLASLRCVSAEDESFIGR